MEVTLRPRLWRMRRFEEIDFDNVMIGGSFGGKDGVGSLYKLVICVGRGQYVVHPSPVLARPLNICHCQPKPNIPLVKTFQYHLPIFFFNSSLSFLLCPLAIITTDSHSPPNSFASLYCILFFRNLVTLASGVGFPISS